MKSNNYLYSITPFWLLLSPWVDMSFQQQLPSELNEIINDVEKDKGRSRAEAEVLWDLSLIESNHLNCDGSLEIVENNHSYVLKTTISAHFMKAFHKKKGKN